MGVPGMPKVASVGRWGPGGGVGGGTAESGHRVIGLESGDLRDGPMTRPDASIPISRSRKATARSMRSFKRSRRRPFPLWVVFDIQFSVFSSQSQVSVLVLGSRALDATHAVL